MFHSTGISTLDCGSKKLLESNLEEVNSLHGLSDNQIKLTQFQNNKSNFLMIKLTVQEIAKHNLTSDCWLIINNKVYNISGYLGLHPGGVSVISPLLIINQLRQMLAEKITIKVDKINVDPPTLKLWRDKEGGEDL